MKSSQEYLVENGLSDACADEVDKKGTAEAERIVV